MQIFNFFALQQKELIITELRRKLNFYNSTMHKIKGPGQENSQIFGYYRN